MLCFIHFNLCYFLFYFIEIYRMPTNSDQSAC